MDQATADRFWAKVRRTDGCWLFNGRDSAYGRFWVGGRLVGAHRVSYAIEFGGVAEDMDVLHRCDRPGCVRPDHLFLGTPADNMADAKVKGRRRFAVGSASAAAKLTDDTVVAIRSRLAGGESCRSVARDLGMHHSSISSIRRGSAWQHLLS